MQILQKIMFAPGQVKILDSQPAIQLRYLAASAAHTAVHKSQGTEERDTELENIQSNNMHEVQLYICALQQMDGITAY